VAELIQLFDVSQNPQMKQILLSGSANVVQCPHCGYQGPLSLPIVYHDHTKDLLLTFFPPEAGIPMHEQEKIFGPLIKKVVDNLPAAERKAYLFQPTPMFTFQSLIDRILEADGITKEMREAQEKRFNLLKEFLETTDGNYDDLIAANSDSIDTEFFGMLTQVIQMAAAQGDQESTANLIEIQNALTDKTEIGKELKKQTEILQKTVTELQDLTKSELTREKLVDFIVDHPSDLELNAIVSSIRPALDYQFFQIFSEKVDKSTGDEKTNLESMRDKLLTMTQAMDQAMDQQMQQSKALLESILNAADLKQKLMQSLPQIDQLFIEVLKIELQQANQNQQTDRLTKLNQIVEILQSLNPPAPEVELIEHLLDLDDEGAQIKLLEENMDMVNENMINLLSNVVTQAENAGQQSEELDKIKKLFRLVLKISMKKQMSGN
jgi:hypothetical protein